jgi:alkylation response protein AidB-like acyl-CoA dehydrogenase
MSNVTLTPTRAHTFGRRRRRTTVRYGVSRLCNEVAMDFSRVELDADDQAFAVELREFLRTHVTDEVIRRDRETGENFDEGVHLALGAAGHLAADWTPESDGGFSALRRRIFELEVGRAHTPWFHWGTTALVAHFVAQFAGEDLRDEVLPGVLTGEIRLCLGYTEPEGGSDVATVKTRAVRDRDDGSTWIVNGAKMFTSNAHNARYVFLLTNTDPDGPKHRNLTLFLVPLASPGVEIQGLRTVDGDRTNIVYYSDVRVGDKYRVGEVNGGWTVMRAALDAEHGVGEEDSAGLQKIAVMTEHALLTAEALDAVAAVVGSAQPDGSVDYRLGRSAARLEAALSTPGMFGRVAIAQTMRDIAPDLMDVLGAASVLPVDTKGAAAAGAAEYVYRLAGPTGVYGGTLEVFRNMIAQHALGLGRPAYAPPR